MVIYLIIHKLPLQNQIMKVSNKMPALLKFGRKEHQVLNYYLKIPPKQVKTKCNSSLNSFTLSTTYVTYQKNVPQNLNIADDDESRQHPLLNRNLKKDP
jgi:hypothetical protein